MHEKENLARNLEILIRGAGLLELPVLATEQYPEGLGGTVTQVAQALKEIRPDQQFIRKMSFSSMGEPACRKAVEGLGRKNVLLAGIETHVCVYQTAMDLLASGYSVQTITDAVSSRTPGNRAVGLGLMERAGAALTSVETALFELMKTAEAPNFRELSKIVK